MKLLKYVFIIILVLISCTDKNRNWTVRDMDTTEYKLAHFIPNLKERLLNIFNRHEEKIIRYFNTNGNMIEWRIYDEMGNLSSRIISKYNEKGQKSEEMNCDMNGKYSLKYSYSYDSNGNYIGCKTYDGNGKYSSGNSIKVVYLNKLCSKSFTYGNHGELWNVHTYKYISNKNAWVDVEEIGFDHNGKLFSSNVMIYDTNGVLTQKIFFDSTMSFHGRQIIVNDSNGKYKESYTYNANDKIDGKHVLRRLNNKQERGEQYEAIYTNNSMKYRLINTVLYEDVLVK